jgi:Mg2+ and Co2+ transporter CorA
MLVDSIQRKYKNENDKVVWVIVIVLVGIIGAIIYYFVVKVNDKK